MSDQPKIVPLDRTCECDDVCRAWLGVLMDPPPVGLTFTVWCPRGRTCALPLPEPASAPRALPSPNESDHG